MSRVYRCPVCGRMVIDEHPFHSGYGVRHLLYCSGSDRTHEEVEMNAVDSE